MNRAARRRAARTARVIEAEGGWLSWWPADDPTGQGTQRNGSARYYTRNGVEACAERNDRGVAMLTLVGPDRDLTLAEIYHARRAIFPEVEFMGLVMALHPDPGFVVCLQQMGATESGSGLITPAR